MASRCIIGKVDGRGSGKAILCSRGCYPDEAGVALLGRYSDESLIDELIDLGSIAWLEAEPKECKAYHRDRGYPWENCQPYSFQGGTETFFGEYWGPGPSGCTSGLPTVGWPVRQWRGCHRRPILKMGTASATHRGLSGSAKRARRSGRVRCIP